MELIKSYQAGGFFMHLILGVGFLAAAIIVERAIALFRTYKSVPADMRSKLMTFISLGQFSEAIAYVEMTAQNTPIGRVVNAGMNVRQIGGADEEVQARMDEALTKEISNVDRRTGFLAVYGNIATLLGLLGTVTGLIASFTSVTNANPAERSMLLGQGIAEALNTTAFGLVVAIPTLLAYAIMQNRTDRIVNEITEASSKMFHDILFRSESRPANDKARNTTVATSVQMDSIQKGN